MSSACCEPQTPPVCGWVIVEKKVSSEWVVLDLHAAQ